ncbi:MAG: carboxypeptidase-like regulatory domain-containing protein, partial [Oscillospiraceae bacterium]|nr:carboxypeptidase-like regulatory domain-containing protein [Oscillospiraceae bacterium]
MKTHNAPKGLLAFLLILVMLMSLLPVPTLAADTLFAEEYGDGSENDPYIISTAQDLAALAGRVNTSGAENRFEGKHFKLANDIDLSAICGSDIGNWISIGSTAANYFGGIFDGNSKYIAGIYIYINETANTNDQGGLFRYITNATIKNLTIKGKMDIKGNNAGGLANTADSCLIENCVNEISISLTANNCGGFLYDAKNTQLVNCENKAQLLPKGGAVGLVFRFSDGTLGKNIIDNCRNVALLKANSAFGIMGSTTGSSTTVLIKNSVNYGDIAATDTNAAGIAETVKGSIINCENYGAVSGNRSIAGIAYSFVGKISDCTNNGAISQIAPLTSSSMGGIVGQSGGNSTNIDNCTNYGTLTGIHWVGGIIGRASPTADNISITNCKNLGDIKGPSSTSGDTDRIFGGIAASVGAGNGAGVSIEDCYNAGQIDTAVPSVGGLIGEAAPTGTGKIAVANSYNSGAVSGDYFFDTKNNVARGVGGLIGKVVVPTAAQQSPSLTLKNVYSSAASVTSKTPDAALGIHSISDSKGNGYAGAVDISNVFVLAPSGGTRDVIGEDKTGIDANAVIPLANEQMTDAGFLALLGGAFAKWSPYLYGEDEIPEDILAEREALYGDYLYPILCAIAGTKKEPTYNVKFTGAKYANVTVNGIDTYATTVAPGGAVVFTAESKYTEEVTIASVKIGDELLVSEDGVYTADNISSDTVITVETEGEPTLEDGETDGNKVTFRVVDKDGNDISDATVTVDDNAPETDSSYRLERGSYTATISKHGYNTVTGIFDVADADETVNVSLYQGVPQDVTLNIGYHIIASQSFGIAIYNGDIRIGVVEKNLSGYAERKLQLPPGDYTYRGFGALSDNMGTGPLTVDDSGATVWLRFVEFSNTLRNNSGAYYTVTVADEDGTVYRPGSADARNGGSARGYFLLPAEEYGKKYHYAFVPTDENMWGSSGDLYLYIANGVSKSFNGLNTSDDGHFVIARKADATFTVPIGAEFGVYHRVRFYEQLEELSPKDTRDNGDGTVTYTYDCPQGAELHYELLFGGYAKKAETFAAPSNMNIPLSSLTRIEDAPVSNEFFDSDLVTNITNSRYIELQSGERFEVYLFRNWQATNSITGNYYIDPAYRIDVIYGDSAEIVYPYYAGASIKAKDGGSGISVVRITYDPLDAVDTNGNSVVYSKLLEWNTLYVIVNVNPQGSAFIAPGINVTENDKVFFTRSVNDIARPPEKQYAEYTFAPTVVNGALANVSVHAPVASTAAWTDEWSDLSPNEDGSYTAKLFEGYNFVRIAAQDGTQSYYAVRAAALDITADGAKASLGENGEFTLAADIGEMDRVTLSFAGLQTPIAKLGAIYNPGYPDTGYLVFDLESEAATTKIESVHTQYGIYDVNATAVQFSSPGEYTLTNGHIHMGYIGSGFSHQEITRGGKTGYQPTYAASGKGIDDALFCYLPDLHFTVTGEPDVGTAYDVTVTVPSGAKLTVKNAKGYTKTPASADNGAYVYSLVNDDSTATYTYYVECEGYLTKTGTFTVTDEAVTLDLTQDWAPLAQEGGTVSVRVLTDRDMIYSGPMAYSTEKIPDLAAKGYAEYNSGGYTALHAIAAALSDEDGGNSRLEAAKGKITSVNGCVPDGGASWAVEINGASVGDYANALVADGDAILLYVDLGAASIVQHHARFEPEMRSVTRGESATLTLYAQPINGGVEGALQGATIYIDGKETDYITNKNGQVTIATG